MVSDILKYQFHKFQFHKRPLAVVVALTDNCNLRCQMCNIWKDKNKNLEVSKWQSILSDNFYSKVKTLFITGGEPCLYRDFGAFIKMAVEKLDLIKIVINTSGYFPKKISDLIEITSLSGIEVGVIISVDGGNETHNRIRGINAFDRAMESASLVRDSSHANLVIKMTVSDQTIDDINDVRAIAKSFDAPLSIKECYHTSVFKNDGMDFNANQETAQYLKNFFYTQSLKKPFTDKSAFQDFVDSKQSTKRLEPCAFIDRTAVYLSGAGKLHVCSNESLNADGELSERLKELKKEKCGTCKNSCLNSTSLRSHLMRYGLFALRKIILRMKKADIRISNSYRQ